MEVNDILREYGDLYKKKSRSLKWPVWPNQLKALRDLRRCRTSELGGHKEVCDTCAAIRISYNSCRNRHCPKCQSLPAQKWILERSDEILPIGHFHVVFTIPRALSSLIINNPHNQQVVYNILFKAASQTLLQLSKDKKFLGAKIGMMGILHTWGQNLMSHPHIHFLVTGGGLATATSKKDKNIDDGNQYDQWVWAKTTIKSKRKRKKKFLFPVKVMSKLFKGIFLSNLRHSHLNGELKLKLKSKLKGADGDGDGDSDGNWDKNFQELIQSINYKKWVVYCKPPIKNASKVIEYFGRYTYRVAISNRRIIKLEDGRVFFKWKDYRDGNKTKIMSLEATEFIRRFLLHILPKRFVKIRYYGLYGNRNRKETIQRCQALLGGGKTASPSETESQSNSNSQNKKWWEIIFERKGIDITLCPFCKVGHMIYEEELVGIVNTSSPVYNRNSRFNYNQMRGPPVSFYSMESACVCEYKI